MCRAICAERINLKDKDAFEKLLERMNGGKEPTIAQAAAASLCRRAIGGNLEALEKLTINNEGKLPDTVNVNSVNTLTHIYAELEGQERQETIDEMRRYFEKLPPSPHNR